MIMLDSTHVYVNNRFKATLSHKHFLILFFWESFVYESLFPKLHKLFILCLSLLCCGLIMWALVCVVGDRIPREMMHKVPTTLLHSLEGMSGLDWKQLLELQSEDGSFLFSPSSTAFALMQTKDENCLKYLNHNVNKFN